MRAQQCQRKNNKLPFDVCPIHTSACVKPSSQTRVRPCYRSEYAFPIIWTSSSLISGRTTCATDASRKCLVLFFGNNVFLKSTAFIFVPSKAGFIFASLIKLSCVVLNPSVTCRVHTTFPWCQGAIYWNRFLFPAMNLVSCWRWHVQVSFQRWH